MYNICSLIHIIFIVLTGYPGSSAGKESTWNAGDLGSIPALGRSPEEGNGNPLQYCGLENPHGQRSLAGYVHGVTELDMTEWLLAQDTHTQKNFLFPNRSKLSHLGKLMAYWHIWKMLKMNRMKSEKKTLYWRGLKINVDI